MIKCWKIQGRSSIYETDLSTKEPEEKENTRIQAEDGNRRRKKSTGQPEKKRQKNVIRIGRISGLLFSLNQIDEVRYQ